MQRKFAENMKELRGLINDWSAPVLLAVSGGIDSMCMAELFASHDQQLPFAVAHCNFHLRGEESDADEALVARWAEAHGVPFHKADFDTEKHASENGISIEMAARDLRYAWFAGLCREHGYHAVAVAHNSNDNAETLVLNMLRGSGLSGLSGMSMLSSVPSEDIPLIRPLLNCSRKQIEGYMFAFKVSYREDSTNASSDYKRNRIRNEVFPVFETVNPSFVRTLNREMGYFAEADEIVGEWCRNMAPKVLRTDSLPLRIGLSELLSIRNWRYLLYHILEPYGFNSSTLTSVEELLTSERTVSGKRFRSTGHVLVTERDELVVTPSEEDPGFRNQEVMPVNEAGTYDFNGRTFKVDVQARPADLQLKQPEGVIIMDAAKLRFPFVMRCWREGDWLTPLGMRGKKKVSDLFTDLKYDSFRKKEAVVIVGACSGDMTENQHIAAVAGVRIDDSCKVTSDTETLIVIRTI
jgi:tRNA(Ile)-lysidine synthase